jgi:MTH538 TIR-like domain (DUF1863)
LLPADTARRVFTSFRGEEKNRVNGLRLLAANDKLDIEFYDESVRTAYNSVNADYIKGRIREKIRRTKVTLCMLSEWTYTSTWCDWEIEESIAIRRWDHNHLYRLISE